MLSVITSWDDGSQYDLRIAELLEKYDISGIFFIPTCGYLSGDDIKSLSKDFEIGGHTTTHPEDLKRLSPKDQYNEIKDNKDYLEEIIGKDIHWFAYPSGRYKPEVTCDLIEKAGFLYARTTVIGYNPIIRPLDYRLKTTMSIYPRPEYKGRYFLQYFNNYIERFLDEDGVLHIWGHGQDLEKYDYWHDLEELFKYIKHLGLQNYD